MSPLHFFWLGAGKPFRIPHLAWYIQLPFDAEVGPAPCLAA